MNSFNNETICSGENVQIGQDLGGGYSYQWTATPDHAFSKTVARPTVNPTQSTSYTLIVTNLASGCSTTESVQVIVNQIPAVNTGGDQTICVGDVITIGAPAQAGLTYEWTDGINTLSNESSTDVSPNTTTIYTLTVTNPATGCSNSDNIVITVNPTPNIDAGNPQTVCSNDIVNLSPTFSNIDLNTINWSSSSQGLVVLLLTFQLTRQVLQTFLMDQLHLRYLLKELVVVTQYMKIQ